LNQSCVEAESFAVDSESLMSWILLFMLRFWEMRFS